MTITQNPRPRVIEEASMARMQRKLLSTPDEVRPFTHGRAEIWELGDTVIGKQVFEPGWRWSKDVQPVAQTDTCEYHHLGMVMSGRLRFETPDGLEMEVGPGMIFEVQPGHDAWVLGDEACVVYDFAGMRTFARPLVGSGQRVLATIVCTDIVDSTATAVRLGDAAWRDLIAEQTSLTRRELDRYRGREATTTGDGILATFDGAERAIHFATAILGASLALGVELRIGVHTGEVERMTDNIRGIAVHTVTRITALAEGGQVLVSGTTYGLLAETSLSFVSRGVHDLKGITRPVELWQLAPEPMQG
ncbi:MAG: adenylate/guanylate cyclase domain-containing protein [Chloroflexi bacterium]|nr:MAG: adenylate/guanylate cyclase domain-containing protein [Chloroflexota bacterium]